MTELLDIEEPTKKYWILFMHSYLIGFVFQVARKIYENIYRFKLLNFLWFCLKSSLCLNPIFVSKFNRILYGVKKNKERDSYMLVLVFTTKSKKLDYMYM